MLFVLCAILLSFPSPDRFYCCLSAKDYKAACVVQEKKQKGWGMMLGHFRMRLY
jgi:hypothetical protein